MALMTVNGIDELRGLVGETVGPSDWREVTQQDVDDFARITGDDQWIHVDVDRAKAESGLEFELSASDLAVMMSALGLGLATEALNEPDAIREELFGELAEFVFRSLAERAAGGGPRKQAGGAARRGRGARPRAR